ncbi:MAG: TIGR04255 family protein [Candidatus Omnitrophica bacterium]|nr:TIGR04255 family protein [Candidatus Omnitrophota bacterium]
MGKIHFNNAPIVEALIDIRAILPPETTLDTLALFQEKIKTDFPEKQTRVSWESSFKVEPNTPPQVSQHKREDGYLFHASDKSQLVQARLDGFTFNKLRPYDKWESFKDKAKELYAHYLEIAKPKNVVRLGLRYINRIEVPLISPIRFEEYFLLRPELPSTLPQRTKHFLTQVVLADDSIGAEAIVTERLEKPLHKDGNDFLPVLLDIDVVKTLSLSPSDIELWNLFEKLKLFEDSIFLESLTARAKELFK